MPATGKQYGSQEIINKCFDGTESHYVKVKGSTLAEQLTQADAVAGVLTFSENISTVEIYNTDATNDGTFEVNGITINVPSEKVFKAAVGGTPSVEVTVAGATTYIVSRYI